ncbi:MAG: HEAT repeat domain-containing protein [Labilithrix sp.]
MRLSYLGILAALLLAAPAFAAPPKPAPAAAKPAPKVDTAGAITKLKSGDEGQIRQALDDLRVAGPAAANAAGEVSSLLNKGLNDVLTVQAIDTLGDLESPDGSPVLALYSTHRNVALRRASVKAMVRTKGPAAATALRRALGDQDAQVRGVAASGLGALKAKDAVPDLFIALDHKVAEAAASIGQLCNPEQCEQLAQKIGKLPFDVVTGGLEQVLARSAADMPDDAKIKIIGRVREMGTGEANRFLKDVQARLPKETSARIKQAIEQAIKATTGGSQ